METAYNELMSALDEAHDARTKAIDVAKDNSKKLKVMSDKMGQRVNEQSIGSDTKQIESTNA